MPTRRLPEPVPLLELVPFTRPDLERRRLDGTITLVDCPHLSGLVAGGRAGVDRMTAILRSEMEPTMTSSGVSSLAELEPLHITQPNRLVHVIEHAENRPVLR